LLKKDREESDSSSSSDDASESGETKVKPARLR